MLPVRIGLRHEFLPSSVNQKSDKVRPHVVASKVSQHFGEMRLVQVDVNEQEPVKILIRLYNQTSVGAIDTSMSVVHGWVGLRLNTGGGILL